MRAPRTSDRVLRDATRPCPVCGGHRVEPLHAQRFVLPDRHPLEGGYDVVCCAACDMVYADTAVPQAVYDRFYAELSKYEDPRTGTGGGEQAWDDARLQGMAATLARFLPARSARIVDVGCANGGLLRCLGDLGFSDLHGVDPAPACAAAAGRIPGVTGHVGSLFALPAGLDGADAVVLSHVLEHVQDLAQGLRHAVSLLRPGGVLYVEVPDATRYAACLAAPFQDFNTEHINHFGPGALRSLIEAHGGEVLAFERKTIEAAPGKPYPAVWVVARMDGARHRAMRDPELRAAILVYIADSAALLRRVDDLLAASLPDEPIAVWGVGQLTLKLLALTRLGSAPIAFFVDTNPLYHGKHLRGAEVRPPEALRAFEGRVLIGTLLHGDAITAQMAAMGLSHEIIRLDEAVAPGLPPSRRPAL